MQIGIVVQDGFFGSAVAALVDILSVAEAARRGVDASIPEIGVSLIAGRRRVTSGSGMVVTATRTLRELDDLDILILPALGTITSEDTEAALRSADSKSIIGALARVSTGQTRVAGACTGVFPLAETGLLDGRTVTTSWFLVPTFRRLFPQIALDVDRMVVADGPVLTAGAAFAHIDLALAILRGISSELTGHVARLLLIDERPSQAIYATLDYLQYDDPLVRNFETYARGRLGDTFDIPEAAQSIGTSRRSLERRTRQVLGMSPLAVVQRLRAERALHLLRTTDLTNEAIARRVGYASSEALRALLRRTSGLAENE
jgi:transcriptional regulator GlxA family with amidase domain